MRAPHPPRSLAALGRVGALSMVVASGFVTPGCAGLFGRRVDFEPMKIVARGTSAPAESGVIDGLDVYDAQMLFDRGLDLSEGAQWRDAWLYFARVEQEFPESALRLPALFNQAICALHLDEGERALALLDRYIASLPEGRDTTLRQRALLKRGQALHQLGRYREAAEIFDVLVVAELPRPLLIEATVDAGIAHFMDGDRITAEYRFMAARRVAREGSDMERRQTRFFLAQASFYLAEILRLDYVEQRLTFPDADALAQGIALEDALGPQLEEKCQRLLRAQAAFTRTVREGHSGWASAAGFKVGEMYEHLHEELVRLPAPASLTDAQRALFQQLLADKVFVLLEKAIHVWQSTVDMATRTGEENLWIEQTRASLARVKSWAMDGASSAATTRVTLPESAPPLPVNPPVLPRAPASPPAADERAHEDTAHAPPPA